MVWLAISPNKWLLQSTCCGAPNCGAAFIPSVCTMAGDRRSIPQFETIPYRRSRHHLVGGIPTPLKNDGLWQLGWWHSQLNGKIKTVPNHQPAIFPSELAHDISWMLYVKKNKQFPRKKGCQISQPPQKNGWFDWYFEQFYSLHNNHLEVPESWATPSYHPFLDGIFLQLLGCLYSISGKLI